MSMPPDESPLTGTEMHTIRTAHGLSLKDLAQYLDVTERTIRRWESAAFPIPDEVVELVCGLDHSHG